MKIKYKKIWPDFMLGFLVTRSAMCMSLAETVVPFK